MPSTRSNTNGLVAGGDLGGSCAVVIGVCTQRAIDRSVSLSAESETAAVPSGRTVTML